MARWMSEDQQEEDSGQDRTVGRLPVVVGGANGMREGRWKLLVGRYLAASRSTGARRPRLMTTGACKRGGGGIRDTATADIENGNRSLCPCDCRDGPRASTRPKSRPVMPGSVGLNRGGVAGGACRQSVCLLMAVGSGHWQWAPQWRLTLGVPLVSSWSAH